MNASVENSTIEPCRRSQTVLAAFLSLALLPHLAAAVTITVTSHGDLEAVDGECSLREAILAANLDAARNECPAGQGADRIALDLDVPRIVELTADLPPVTQTLAIHPVGDEFVIVFGNDQHRMFVFDSATDDQWFLIERLMLANGSVENALENGAAVSVFPGETAILRRTAMVANVSAGGGGAIAVASTPEATGRVELIECDLHDNQSSGARGGGAIYLVDGSVARVESSSLWDNVSSSQGGGIFVQRGSLFVARSTISGNRSDSFGGGIAAQSSGGAVDLEIVDSTLHANVADADASGAGEGGGLSISGTVAPEPRTLQLRNSIVAGNSDLTGPLVHPDIHLISDVALEATGWNLIGVNEGAAAEFAAGTPNAAADFVGTAAAPIDPRLEVLDYNADHFAASHRPLLEPGSPVIDQGACPSRVVDQLGRGEPATGARAVDHPSVANHSASDGCDIGSFERGAALLLPDAIFSDGLELGHTLLWSAEVP